MAPRRSLSLARMASFMASVILPLRVSVLMRCSVVLLGCRRGSPAPGGQSVVPHQRQAATSQKAKNADRDRRSCGRSAGTDQYMRTNLRDSRDTFLAWRFTAAAALRLRAQVGFS